MRRGTYKRSPRRMLFTSSATFVGAFVGVCSQMYACALRKVPLFHRTFLFLFFKCLRRFRSFVFVFNSRGNDDDDVVPLFVCDIYASADEQHRAFSPPITTTMMIHLAQLYRTAAPRWIRRRRRVDRGMVGPKRTEFAERCRRFGRRATGEERRLQ